VPAITASIRVDGDHLVHETCGTTITELHGMALADLDDAAENHLRDCYEQEEL
jgi:hypothetical protein